MHGYSVPAVLAMGAAIGAVAPRAEAGLYSIDDGIADGAVGANYSGATNQAAFLNTFSLVGGDSAINKISIKFGLAPGPSNNLLGLSFTALIYSDANGGTPWDGSLVWTGSGTISSVSSTFVDIAVPDVGVASNFAVGFLFNAPSGGLYYPAGFDTSAPLAGRSYVAITEANGTLDLNDLGAAPNRGAVESFGAEFAGNFMIRANAVPAPGAIAFLGIAGLARRRRR